MQIINLHGVIPDRNFEFHRGKSYLIKAESGRGKSSLCSFLYGLRNDFCGSITFDGVDLTHLSASEWDRIRQDSLGFLPQDLRLFPDLTSLENVMVKAGLTGYYSESEAVRMLCELGLSDKLNWPVRLLSYGQQQRVAFVRMLCQKADFFILDEPVSHLDEDNAVIMAQMLSREVKKLGAGVIVTTIGHDLPYDYDEILTL